MMGASGFPLPLGIGREPHSPISMQAKTWIFPPCVSAEGWAALAGATFSLGCWRGGSWFVPSVPACASLLAHSPGGFIK